MSEDQGSTADPQNVPMAEKYGTHGAVEPNPANQEGTERAFDAENAAPPPGPGREVSDEEREGVSATDTTAATPLGVGGSINRRGEDVVKEEGTEPGRETTGYKDERPVGTADERSGTSVDPGGSESSTGSDMPPGDGGG
ncbi:MAG: hypothetical protein H0V64_06390 [Geodermatophilaceae bacterium]|jgi:hypothetical protein|nr:hypothetical protein [Geodermatophilaceae bacterium]MDQ3463500.1 hypothetical protein [Actinomycetota bacterium]